MAITVTLDEDLARRLEDAGVTNKEAFARRALSEALDDLTEDQTWTRIADERKRSESEERIWSLDEIERGDDLES